jgi:hypothetical protein
MTRTWNSTICEVGEEETVSTYGMHYDAGNAKVIKRAKALSDAKWRAFTAIKTLPARKPLNACVETVLRRHVDKVYDRDFAFRENYEPTIWKDGRGELYIVDGHTRAAMYYELNEPMPVRIMDEKSLCRARWLGRLRCR